MRALLLLASVGALMLPGIAQAQSLSGGGLAGVEAETRPRSNGWRVNEMNDIAFVYSQDRAGALSVSCYEDFESPIDFFIAFGVPNGFDVQTNKLGDTTGALARLFRGVTIMQVTARDADGGAIIVFQMQRWQRDGDEGWSATLTPDQLAGIRAARQIDLQTNRWSGVFTGSGSTRAISDIRCLQS